MYDEIDRSKSYRHLARASASFLSLWVSQRTCAAVVPRTEKVANARVFDAYGTAQEMNKTRSRRVLVPHFSQISPGEKYCLRWTVQESPV